MHGSCLPSRSPRSCLRVPGHLSHWFCKEKLITQEETSSRDSPIYADFIEPAWQEFSLSFPIIHIFPLALLKKKKFSVFFSSFLMAFPIQILFFLHARKLLTPSLMQATLSFCRKLFFSHLKLSTNYSSSLTGKLLLTSVPSEHVERHTWKLSLPPLHLCLLVLLNQWAETTSNYIFHQNINMLLMLSK